ncbi:dihydroorotate oxidase electron transfer subunit [Cryobacterium sp. SO1]|uniref:iron-sulfur cluster-binding protein n=1 Tax=Cryobacterium sp. SO1 TaxID=1897061 RepID=UPI0010E5645C|nr:dihydroorotate oxidase electron transfer subunit [Cryobacterium sp. SO1]RZI36478.1 Dihydroorotate dehydrogenase B (NAD(+)), electron transfer subunit [Cryobacterium sp. SO1]
MNPNLSPQVGSPGLLRQAQHGVDKLDQRKAAAAARRAAAARQRAFAEADAAALAGLISVRPPSAVPRPQPVWDDAEVLVHEPVGERYRRLVLASDTIAHTAQAGQFLMITVPPNGGDTILLPRPMAIHRRRLATPARPATSDRPAGPHTAGTIELIYGVVGRGTRALAAVAVGSRLQVTGPLGRGFDLAPGTRSALLIGRGVGICGVMGAAEDAAALGIRTTMVLSGQRRDQLLGRSDCAELGTRVIEATDDNGSSDLATLKTRLLADFDGSTAERTPPEVVMVCGAGVLARLAAELGAYWGVPVQASLEAHMACGLGYCHGCAAPVQTDPSVEGPLVCADGPVFDARIPVD